MMATMADRKRDADATRDRILVAARDVFSRHGFGETGVRDIAKAAEVSPGLVSRYFGSKEGLFEAALESVFDHRVLTSVPREHFGHALLERLIEQDGTGGHPLNMMMLSTSDPGARAITERLVRTRLAAPLAQWFGTDDAQDRAARLLLVTAGLFLYRSVFPLDPLTGTLSPGIRAWLEAQLQAIVTP